MSARARLKAKSLLGRLTGFSVGVPVASVGLSWNVPADERDLVRRLLTFLEDRRVLYVAEYLEIPNHVTKSVLQIRAELTTILGQLPGDSRAAGALRAMRAACRKFLEEEHPDFRHVYLPGIGRPIRHEPGTDGGGTPGFFVALGELRATFGIHIAALAYEYQLDLEPELAAILPATETAN
jgi:hypothetical protein